jgi:uncharacterized membrane protein
MLDFLFAVTLFALGTITGIYLCGSIHDHRVRDLSADQYVAMHQMRDKTFRAVMPWLAFSTLALVLVCALLATSSGWPRLLALAAVALLIADIAFTVRRQLPINQAIQSWEQSTLPSDWHSYRDKWAGHHNVRTGLLLLAGICLLGASVLN